MPWKQLIYSRSQVINAGKTIRDKCCSAEDQRQAISIIDNWRAAHAYPLHVVYIHLRRLAKSTPESIVAERLKRLDSIISKLNREHSMNLWTMQDLGGCRVIVPTMRQLYRIASNYQHSSIRHNFKGETDYIAFPKASGYRSLHHVYEYHSDKRDTYNRNMLIEVQFRTRLQHSWATAVETMGLFTNQSLKAGEGDTETKRFFALVSSLFAIEESAPLVPETYDNKREIVNELKFLDEKRSFLRRLEAITVAVNYLEPNSQTHIGYVILKISLERHELEVLMYKASAFDEAVAHYHEIEQMHEESQTDAVLVRTASITALRQAYPNYFTDNSSFVEKVASYIGRDSKNELF